MTTQPLNKTASTEAPPKGFSWRIFGPGILMATAAIGGSHLISSTQACHIRLAVGDYDYPCQLF